MATPDRFESLSAALEDACRRQEGVSGLVLLGSAAESSRRDEWSDHDFFLLLEPGVLSLRDDLSWLPDADRIVLTASEGEIGRVVVYDDGHVLEFAVGTEAELAVTRVNRNRIVYDEDGCLARVVERALAPRPSGTQADAVNDIRLFLVKILIGVGRIRRGEVLNGARFVRAWAVDHLVKAIRIRLTGADPGTVDDLDPLRRFELDYPRLGERIESALAHAPEHAARALLAIARDVLEPGWDEFPARAADAVADRLGWAGGDPRSWPRAERASSSAPP